MKIASVFLFIISALFTVSCSDSSEAKTRKQQEAKFTQAFGFSPPPTIANINYSDLYNRGTMDGAYGQWLAFTFQQASFDKIILKGYKKEHNGYVPNSGAAPSWWPQTIPNGTIIFSRSQDDAPAKEGFQFREYIWHDRTSDTVFFHKSYWD